MAVSLVAPKPSAFGAIPFSGYGVPKPKTTSLGGYWDVVGAQGQDITHHPIGGTQLPGPGENAPGTFIGQTVNTQGTPMANPAAGSAGIDWKGLIGSSWEVDQAQAMMAAQMARARANLQNTLRQNFIDLGIGDKTQLGSLGSYIDKATIQKAIANKYSIYGQVREQEARANASNAAELAARGILSSGQTTKSTQDVTNAAEQSRYTGLREFLRTGQQGVMGLGDTEAQLAQGVMQAQFAAAQRIAQEQAAAAAAAAAANAGTFAGRTDTAPQLPTVPTPYEGPVWDPNAHVAYGIPTNLQPAGFRPF